MMRAFCAGAAFLLMLSIAFAQTLIVPGVSYEDSLQPGGGHLYSFNVSQSTRQVVITVTVSTGTYAPNILVGVDYVPHEQFYEMSSQGASRENYISALATDYVFWAGEWYILLQSGDTANITYNFRVNAYACINNCSARGVCEPATGTCACYGEYSGTDCSIQPFVSSLPVNFTENVGPDGDWDVFRLELPRRYAYATRHLYALCVVWLFVCLLSMDGISYFSFSFADVVLLGGSLLIRFIPICLWNFTRLRRLYPLSLLYGPIVRKKF